MKAVDFKGSLDAAPVRPLEENPTSVVQQPEQEPAATPQPTPICGPNQKCN